MITKNLFIDYLVELALACDFECISEKSLERVKTILLHDLSIGLCSLREPSYQAAIKITKHFGYSKSGRFTLIGNGLTNSLDESAFLNAMLMSSKAQEDFHGALHLGPIVIAAVFAASEDVKASGQDIISALTAGFETGLTMGDVFGSYCAKRGMRGTPLFGQIGAAVAVARLLGLNKTKLKFALSHAAANVAGTAESLLAGTTEWHFQAGWAARKALWAAYIAEYGLTGSSGTLFGNAGFAQAYGSPDKFNAGLLKKNERILEVGLKRYPVNIFVMTPLEAVLRISKSIFPKDGKEINHITIEMNEKDSSLPLLSKVGSFDYPGQGILSVSYCVAVALLNGNFNRFLVEKNIKDKLTLYTAEKVKIIPRKDLPSLSTRVTVKTDHTEYCEKIFDINSLYFLEFNNELTRLKLDIESFDTDCPNPEVLVPLIKSLDSSKSALDQLFNTLKDI